jgi:hypothetical protein
MFPLVMPRIIGSSTTNSDSYQMPRLLLAFPIGRTDSS